MTSDKELDAMTEEELRKKHKELRAAMREEEG